MQKSISFKLLPRTYGISDKFWNLIVPVSNCSRSIDQQNVVWCNSVIEELSFHLENVVVRIDLSCSNF